MIVYWALLLVTAVIAYSLGSMSSIVLASKYVFRTNLRKLGTGNRFLANFYRVYGIGGGIKLLIVELLRDILPILLGGVLLGIKGHADAGRLFAAFCLVFGRVYPLFYEFKGSHATVCLLTAAMFADTSAGIATLLATVAVLWFTKYVSLGTIVGAAVFLVTSMLLVDDNLCMVLCILCCVLVIIKHIAAAVRLLNGTEKKFSFREDLSYKFDQKIR